MEEIKERTNEAFLKMLKLKEYQKLFPENQRKAKEEFRRKHSEIDKKLKTLSDDKEREELMQTRPIYMDSDLEFDPRAFNIIYGMVRGRSYKEIEPKTKEGNLPPINGMEKIIKAYGLNLDDFIKITPNPKWPQYPFMEVR